MVMDAAVSKITRNMAGGVVENTSQRTVLLVTKPRRCATGFPSLSVARSCRLPFRPGRCPEVETVRLSPRGGPYASERTWIRGLDCWPIVVLHSISASEQGRSSSVRRHGR